MPSRPIVHVCINYTSLSIVRLWSKSKPLQATLPSPHFCPLFSLYVLGTMEEQCLATTTHMTHVVHLYMTELNSTQCTRRSENVSTNTTIKTFKHT